MYYRVRGAAAFWTSRPRSAFYEAKLGDSDSLVFVLRRTRTPDGAQEAGWKTMQCDQSNWPWRRTTFRLLLVEPPVRLSLSAYNQNLVNPKHQNRNPKPDAKGDDPTGVEARRGNGEK